MCLEERNQSFGLARDLRFLHDLSLRAHNAHAQEYRAFAGKLVTRKTVEVSGQTTTLTGSIDTFVINFVITGKFTLAGSVAATEMLTKIALFYCHERFWALILWGCHS